MDDYSRRAVNLGRKLRKIRCAAGLTQKRVGIGLGFRPQSARKYVSRIETGRLRHVTVHTVQTFLRVCGPWLAALSELQDELPAISTGSVSRSLRPRLRRHVSTTLPSVSLGVEASEKSRNQKTEKRNQKYPELARSSLASLRSDFVSLPSGTVRPTAAQAVVADRQLTPAKSGLVPPARKSRELPLRLVLYNLQWSAVNEAVKAFLSQVEMSDVLRAHARKFAHGVLALEDAAKQR